MSTNEEPKNATEPADVLNDELTIDLDDVEGHGIREVAAGLGAAAVLAGGGTAAAATVGVHPSLPDLHPSTPSVSHPVDQVDRATDWAIDSSRDLRDGAIDTAANAAQGATSIANHQVSATSSTAGAAVAGVDRAAGSAVDVAGSTVRAEVRVAGQAVNDTETIAANTTRGTVKAAGTTASTATTTTTATVNEAARKAATVVQLTTSTVNALETTIVATVTNLNPQAGAGTSSASSGWVTFSLGGENIASVQLSNGQASVTVKTVSLAGKVLQAVYSGDTVHAASTRSITL